MYTQHVVLDFEMNQVAKEYKSLRRRLRSEIIEIGAVKLNAEYEVTGKFHRFVCPQYNTKVTGFITNLTGIKTPEVFDAEPFTTVIRELEEWIGNAEKTRVYSWSDSDLLQIKNECELKRVDFPRNMRRWMDFQAVYSRIMDIPPDRNRKLALRAAAEQFGVRMDAGKAHSALYDAEITTDLVISALNGECRRQAELLKKTYVKGQAPASQTLGDACRDAFLQLIQQMQYESEYAR